MASHRSESSCELFGEPTMMKEACFLQLDLLQDVRGTYQLKTTASFVAVLLLR